MSEQAHTTPEPQASAPSQTGASPADASSPKLDAKGRTTSQRWTQRAVMAGGSVLVLWSVGWLAVPPILKWQAEKQASALLGRKVTIGEVAFKPWALQLTLKQLAVAKAEGQQGDQLTVDRIHVDAAIQSLFRLAPVLDAVEVDAPKVHVRHLGNGHYDFDDVLKRLAERPSDPPDPNAKPAKFALYNVALRGGEFTFDDEPVQGHHELRALDVQLPFISNLDSQREVKVLPKLAFVLDGSKFDSAAETLPFMDTRQTQARFKVDALDLSDYAAYVPASVPIALKSAVLDADLTLSFEQHQDPSLLVQGVVKASQFNVQERDGTPLAAFDRLVLELGEVRPLAQQVHLKSVQLDAPRLRLTRDPHGLLNLLRLAKATAQDGPKARTAAAPQAGASGAGAAANSVAASASGSMGGLPPENRTVASNTARQPASRPAAAASASGTAAGAKGATATTSTAKAAPSSLQLQVDRIAITGGDISWLDQAAGQPDHPAHLQLAQLQVDASGLVLPMNKPVRFSGSGVLSELKAGEAAVADAAGAGTGAPAPGAPKAGPGAPSASGQPASPASAAGAGKATNKPGDSGDQPTRAPVTPSARTQIHSGVQTVALGAAQASAAGPGAHSPASPASSAHAADVTRAASVAASASPRGRAASTTGSAAAPAPARAASGSVPVLPATAGQALPPVPAIQALADLPAGGLSFAGEATQSTATVQTHVQALPLALALPYVRSVLRPQLAGALSASSELHWSAADAKGEGGDMRLKLAQLTIDELALQQAGDKPAKAVSIRASKNTGGSPSILPHIKQLALEDVDVLPLTQQVKLGKLAITDPQLQVSRNAKGQLMYEEWLVSAPAKADAATSPAPAAKPWQLALGELSVKGGRVGWRDELPERAVEATLSDLSASVKGFELNGKQPMQVQLASRLAAGRTEPGRLSWQGAITQAPLAAKGDVNLQRLPVHAFEPYFGGLLNIELLRADASFKGKVDFASGDKGPRVKLTGDASVEEFRAHSVAGSITDGNAPEAVADSATQRKAGATQTTSAGPVPTRGQAQREQAAAAGAPASTAKTSTTATGKADAASGAAQAAQAARADARAAEARTGAVASGAPLAPIASRQGRGGLRLGEELLSWKTLHVRGLDVAVQPGARPVVNVAETRLADFFARVIVYPNGRLNLQDLVKAAPGEAAAASANAASGAAASASAPAAPAAAAAASVPASGASAAVAAAPATGPVLRFGPTQLVGGKVYFSDRFIKPNYSADLTELTGSLNAFSSEPDPSGAVQMAELALTGRAEGTASLDISGKLNPLAKPLALDVTGKVHDLELPPLSPYAIKYSGYGIERGKMSVDVHYEVLPSGQLTANNKLVLNQLTFGEKVEGAPASLPVKLAVTLLADRNGVIDLDLPISGSLNDPQFSVGPIVVKAIFNIIGKAVTAPFTLLAKAFGGSGDEMSQVAFAPGSSRLTPQARQNLDKVAKALIDRPSLKLTVNGTADLDTERAGYQKERLKALVAAEKRRDEVTGGKGKDKEDDATAMPSKAAAASGVASGSASASASAGAASASAPAASASAAAATLTAAAPEITGAEYEALLKKVYKRSDIKKPRNAIGLAKDLPVPEMERLLMDSVPVGENQMRQLAQARATVVRDYLATQQLPTDRLFVGSAQLGKKAADASEASKDGAADGGKDTGKAGAKGWTPRAELSLKS